jgi:hypothetical protein
MHWAFAVFPPLVGVAVVVLGLRWALTEHREERRRWLSLLDFDRGALSPFQVFEGVVVEGPTETASFSNEPCVASRSELIGRTHFANEYTYQRLAVEASGVFTLQTVDGRTVQVEFDDANPVMPPDLVGSENASPVIRRYAGGGDSAPEHVQAWAEAHVDDQVWRTYFEPSRDKVFTAAKVICLEHRITPGQRVVIAGDVSETEDGRTVVSAGPQGLFFALGSLEAERKRVARLPVESELFGAVMAGVLAAAVTGGVVAAFLPKPKTGPARPVVQRVVAPK